MIALIEVNITIIYLMQSANPYRLSGKKASHFLIRITQDIVLAWKLYIFVKLSLVVTLFSWMTIYQNWVPTLRQCVCVGGIHIQNTK